MEKTGLFRRSRKASSTTGRRSLKERGAAMVEFALVAPLFFLVVFGGIEIGLMFRSYLALENITRSSARIASIERNNDTADDNILARIENQVGPLQGDVTSVVIFRASSLDADVPDPCRTASRSGLNTCNFYDIETHGFTPAALASVGWPEASRVGGENIGIYIEFKYTYATGFFDTLTLSSTTIEVIEQDFQ